MTPALTIALALILDAAFGEPRWLWSRLAHPTIVAGRVISWLDTRLNRGSNRTLRGVLAVTLLVIAAAGIGLLVQVLPASPIVEVAVAAVLLAHRSLIDHVSGVADALRSSLADGRVAVARIVGRDTGDMDQTAVIRGTIESAAENLSDGVIAPVFWFLIAGLPGMLVYKLVNTADSMIGYKTEPYARFGWAAARLDDVLNWVPARLTSMLIALAHLRPDIAATVRRDARLHRSPNAGWPEAAMAVCLNISLAGRRSYQGQMQTFPLVYPEGTRAPDISHIGRTVTALWKTWALTLVLVLLLAVA